MIFYLTTSNIPELTSLTPQQRALVESACLRPLLLRSWVRLSKVLVLFPIMLSTLVIVPEVVHTLTGKIVAMVLGLAVFFTSDYLFDMAVISSCREAIGKYVSEHEHELR